MRKRIVSSARWLVMVLSVVNILGAAAALVVIWKFATNMPLPERINDSSLFGSSLLFAAVVFLIAWRAGDQPANLMLALAFAFAGSNGIFGLSLEELRVNAIIRYVVEIPTFILAAGFFIRASQHFPRKLTLQDIALTRTIWGRIKPLRAVVIFFLRAPAVWVFAATAGIINELSSNEALAAIGWISIVVMSLIYFYIMYRSGDVEVRRKVLWFLELPILSLVLKVLLLAARAVLHERSSETLPIVISVLLDSARLVAQLFCVCMAVFYAGAISPALVIRKTFVYGVTVALLLFTYATVEAFVANFLVDKIGVSNSFANAMLGTVLALAFHPIKNRLEHALRRFQFASTSQRGQSGSDLNSSTF